MVPVTVADIENGVGVTSGLKSFGGFGPERIIAPIMTASTISPANSRPTSVEAVILPQSFSKKTLIFTALFTRQWHSKSYLLIQYNLFAYGSFHWQHL